MISVLHPFAKAMMGARNQHSKPSGRQSALTDIKFFDPIGSRRARSERLSPHDGLSPRNEST